MAAWPALLGSRLGPVGLLATLVLCLRGAEVYGLDIVDPDTTRPQWLAEIGGQYIDGRQIPVEQVDEKVGAMELIMEAMGGAALEFNLLDTLARVTRSFASALIKPPAAPARSVRPAPGRRMRRGS